MTQVSRATENGWAGQLRRVLLAGVGVAFLAKDEVQDLVDRLVAKGETAERDGRKLVTGLLSQPTRGLTDGGKRVIDQLGRRTKNISKDVVTRLETAAGVTRGLVGTVTGGLQKRINRRIEKALHRVNLVSKSDVDDLNSKIDQLSRKLDKLGKK